MCRNGRHILSKIRHVLRFALLITSLRSCPLTIILLYIKKKTSDHRLLNNFKNEIYQVMEWQCYYLWGLSKVELILINAHFSYARAALEMFCTLSYAQIIFLWLLLNVYYSNRTIRLQIHTTLMTSDRGEQSVPGAIQRGLPCTFCRAAFSNYNFRLCIFLSISSFSHQLYILYYLFISLFFLTWNPL